MNKRVVLFHPNPFSETRPYFGAPLALLSISRLLAKDYDIKIIHPYTHKNFRENVLRECAGAICLGITSITGYQIFEGRQVAKLVKSVFPNLPIVWGGWHPSILPEETIKDDYVDILVAGQGERAFADIVHRLEKGENLNKQIFKYPLEPLDNFPRLPYHLIDTEKFIVSQEYGKRCLHYTASYGCPNRCAFCVEDIVTKRKWVCLSAQHMIDELEDMKNRYNLDSIAIIDSNFFVDRGRVRTFCDLALQGHLNLKFGNLNARTSISRWDDMWDLMAKAGLAGVLTGAESASQETCDTMLKDIDIDDVYKLAEKCKKYNIKILLSYVMGYPCKNSVETEINLTISQIKKLMKIHKRIRYMTGLYFPYPCMALFTHAETYNIKIPKSFEGWSTYMPVTGVEKGREQWQEWVSKRQSRKILMLTYYIFFFLDPDSLNLVIKNIRGKRRFLIPFYWTGFQTVKLIVRLRWALQFYGLPIDFYAFNWCKKYFGLV